MKQNYNNKTKLRSAWFALVLLMLTALPITAQNAGDRFQVGILWYEVVDATKHTVKVTYANENLDKAKARQLEFDKNLDYVNNGTRGGDDKADGTYKGYSGTLNNTITIPEKVTYQSKDWTVTAIGTCAFINERGTYDGNAKKAIQVNFVLPSTIEHIEEAAFYQAYACTINFPEGLKTIGRQAFYRSVVGYYYTYRNTKFRRGVTKKPTVTITIPGQTAIGPQAFELCSTAGAALSCPNIRYLGYQAFKGSGFLTEVPKSANLGVKPEDTDTEITDLYKTLPGVDQRSGVEAFAESKATSVTLQDGITTIPTGMFENAFKELAKFVIPLSVTTIEERAFANAGIKSFNELSAVKKIGARAFENGKLTGDFFVLDNVEEIGNEAFKGNVNLTGFTLKGNTNCTVGAGFLEGCTNVEYLDLRDVNSTVVKNNLKNLSREANSNTITAGLPTHTLVYLPNVSDISIAAGQDVNFVKSDGTCTKLVLVDGADYEFPYAITANKVVYQRDLPSLSHFIEGKNCFTIFLPYAVTLPPGIRAYNLDYLKRVTVTEYGEPKTTEIYMFKSIPDGSTLEANRPYLLRITDGKTHSSEKFEAVGNPVVIAASGEKLPKSKLLKPQCFVKAESDQSYAFYGSTERTSIYWYKDGNIGGETNKDFCPWVLNVNYPGKDVWRQYATKKEEFVPPFRGFILRIPGTPGAKQFTVLSEGETTGINDVTGNTDVQQGAQRIYTMDGRYVGTDFDSLPSGMYIMKGKKTLKTK